MNRNIGEKEVPGSFASQRSSAKRGTRDSDILLLMWEVFKTRANEIDSLLDLSLSMLSTASDFPQKTDLEDSLRKALAMVRNLA